MLLAHLGRDVLLPMQTELATKAAALPAAIDVHCDALEAGAPGATLGAARTSWAETIDAWQRVDAVAIGPVKVNTAALRTRIYAWPQVAQCELDRDTASRFADPTSYDIETRFDRVRSLAAVEYLLHSTDPNHKCVIAPPGWNDLGANLPRARCRLAEAIAVDVAAQTAALATAWRADGGDFAGELARAGQSGSMFTTAHQAVNVVSDGLFFVDYTVKDTKIAEPAGIAQNDCGTVGTPCPQAVEHAFSDRATFALRANLSSLRDTFTGTSAAGNGIGFDDFLRELGHGDVADRMVASLDGAVAAAAALPDSFTTALANDYEDVVATHAAVKRFTDDLKSQFLTLLALELPNDVPADND